MTSDFTPFSSGAESLTIGAMTIEDQGDRLAIYGSLDITADKRGLADARNLAGILTKAIAELEFRDLPDVITTNTPVDGKNPFGI